MKVRVLIGSLSVGKETYSAGDEVDLPDTVIKNLRVAPLRPADIELLESPRIQVARKKGK